MCHNHKSVKNPYFCHHVGSFKLKVHQNLAWGAYDAPPGSGCPLPFHDALESRSPAFMTWELGSPVEDHVIYQPSLLVYVSCNPRTSISDLPSISRCQLLVNSTRYWFFCSSSLYFSHRQRVCFNMSQGYTVFSQWRNYLLRDYRHHCDEQLNAACVWHDYVSLA